VGKSLSLRAGLAGIAGGLALALFGFTAQADAIGLAGLVAEPADTQAGANSDLHVHMDLTDASDDLQDMTLMLPPGLAGNPQIPAKCPIADFNADACVAEAAVGTTTVSITALGLLPLNVSGTVYNLVPNPDEPARLGIVLRPAGDLLPLGKIFTQVEVQLRPGDLGLNSVINDLPNTASGAIPIDINSVDLVLDESFASNPTSCAEATTTFVITSYAAPTTPVSGTASFTPTGCEGLPFSPEASLAVDAGAKLEGGESPEVVTVVEQDPGEANTKKVVLTLPLGLGPDPNVAFGAQCTQADFAAHTCPAPTNVGAAVAESPLLASPLAGSVFMVEPPGGALPVIGIDLQGDLDIQLPVTAAFVSGPGGVRVESILDGLPDLPLSRFTLTFDGGQGGLFIATDTLCDDSSRLDGTFDSHAGGQVTTSVLPQVTGCTAAGGGGGGRARARCGGRRATKVGTRGPDRIRGTRRADVIAGLGGRDVIRGLGGKDVICGHRGRDRLLGGRGRDRLIGGKGPDALIGGPGLDRLMGGRARDLERQ
jgi:hypothetical protein